VVDLNGEEGWSDDGLFPTHRLPRPTLTLCVSCFVEANRTSSLTVFTGYVPLAQ
jgi:hypothetical protein